MAEKRKVIGLVFTGSENWIGGLYYIANIVKAIQYLPKEKQPHVVLLYNSHTPQELLEDLKFENVTQVFLYDIALVRRIVYSALFRLLKKNFLFKYHIQKYKIDILYPFNEYHADLEFLPCSVYYWIFDFQHKFLPELFSEEEIIRRDNEFELIASKAVQIVVSSNTAKKHFSQFFKNSKANVNVLRFASIINEEKLTPFEQLIKKFNINGQYFLVSNQFWHHKNHIVILKAINEIRKQEKTIQILFTGRNYDPRNPGYFDSLIKYINENKLEDYVKFLGFISREDQLGLMKNCIAVIQPSKFEGWGTVVEDAKTLGKQVILSDIEIHREQFDEAIFFGEDDYMHLAKILLDQETLRKKVSKIKDTDLLYTEFAQNIAKALSL